MHVYMTNILLRLLYTIVVKKRIQMANTHTYFLEEQKTRVRKAVTGVVKYHL